MKWTLEKILPIVLCLLFPAINYITTHDFINPYNLNGKTFMRWAIISIMLYILWQLLFYINIRVKKHKWIKFVAVCLIYMFITYNLFAFSSLIIGKTIKWMFMFRMFMAIVPFTVIQFALRTNRKIAEIQLEKEQVLTENYRVQLEALRSKVDPHFLFNSLNTLRGMVHNQHPQSEEFILNLADFYRQALKYNENTTLSLAEEVKMLEAFLFLMKSRNEKGVKMELQIAENLKDWQLPTLSLQMLAENCFKHNAMSSKMPLFIKIYTSEDGCVFIENNINPKFENREPSGYGLENLKKRYELLNIENGVVTQTAHNIFSVKIKLIQAS